MRRSLAVCAVVGIALCAALIPGCKKRYFPKVTEEIIDPGVPVYQETVVE